MAETAPRPIVIVIGNPDRGDDAAGRLAARRLAHLLPPSVTVIELDGEVSSLLAHLETASAAWLIDACKCGAPAGTIKRFDAGTTALPKDRHDFSSHAFGLPEAIELAGRWGGFHVIASSTQSRARPSSMANRSRLRWRKLSRTSRS